MYDRPPIWPGETQTATIHLRPVPGWPPLADQRDALADPADEDIALHLHQLLPSGAAWRSPDRAAFDSNSRMGGFLRGLASDMARLYRLIFGVAMESTASTLANSLDDWEREFGLPDPCLGEDPATDARLRFLLAKVRSAGTITPQEFIDLAATIGYTIDIEEPVPFECGRSDLGGLHEVAGGPLDGHAIEFYWIVSVSDVPAYFFECGVSECDIDALTEFGHPTALICLFRAVSPAWTIPIFSY